MDGIGGVMFEKKKRIIREYTRLIRNIWFALGENELMFSSRRARVSTIALHLAEFTLHGEYISEKGRKNIPVFFPLFLFLSHSLIRFGLRRSFVYLLTLISLIVH